MMIYEMLQKWKLTHTIALGWLYLLNKDEDEDEDEDEDKDKDKDKDKSQYHLAIFQGHLHFRLDVLALLVNRPVQLDVHL